MGDGFVTEDTTKFLGSVLKSFPESKEQKKFKKFLNYWYQAECSTMCHLLLFPWIFILKIQNKF